MKNKKCLRHLRVLFAWTLVMIMLMQSLNGMQISAKASEYSYVTMESLGFANREYWGSETRTYKGASWDKKILVMDVAFQSELTDMETYKNDINCVL